MDRKKEVFHAKGQEDLRSRSRDYHHVQLENEFDMDGETYYTMIGHCYTPEEDEENRMYGNQQHEEYLNSSQYEHDCKNEQWDWLKNEC